MEEEDNLRAQEDEVAVLESIYADDLTRLGAKEFQVRTSYIYIFIRSDI
jgi:hypothetical protein